MTLQQSSFLLRCWSRNGTHERIQVEHIQSGEQFVTSSVAEAIEWICAHDDSALRAEQPGAAQHHEQRKEGVDM
jgi:hypothetical protein